MSANRPPATLILTLRPGHSGEALHVLPDIGGNFLYSRLLTRHLAPDRPILGLKLPGIPVAELALMPMEQLADRLAAALDVANPGGPHHLLGHSFAGLLAFETARALERRGSRAGLVAILDTGVPSGWLGRHVGQVLASVRRAGQRLRKTAQPASALVLCFPGYATFNLGNHPVALRAIIKALYGMMIAYRPGPYSGPVLVIRGAGRAERGPADLGWSRLAKGGVVSADVEADHLGLVREDASARRVAGLVEQALHGQ
ncbi:MAG: thioesterase domain-containing protein [Cypionkella sp.]